MGLAMCATRLGCNLSRSASPAVECGNEPVQQRSRLIGPRCLDHFPTGERRHDSGGGGEQATQHFRSDDMLGSALERGHRTPLVALTVPLRGRDGGYACCELHRALIAKRFLPMDRELRNPMLRLYESKLPSTGTPSLNETSKHP